MKPAGPAHHERVRGEKGFPSSRSRRLKSAQFEKKGSFFSRVICRMVFGGQGHYLLGKEREFNLFYLLAQLRRPV